MYLLQCSHYKQCLVHERRSVGLDITYTLFQYRVATQKFPKQRSLVPEAKSSQWYRLYRKDGCGQCDVIHWFLSLSWHFSKCHVIYLFIFLELNINILDALSLTKLLANSEKANGSTTWVKIGQQLPRINKNEQTKTKALKKQQLVATCWLYWIFSHSMTDCNLWWLHGCPELDSIAHFRHF